MLLLSRLLDLIERLPAALDRVACVLGALPASLVVAVIGNVLAAALALSFRSEPDGVYFAIAGQNIAMVFVAGITFLVGCALCILELAREKKLFRFLVGIFLSLTPFCTYVRIKAVIFAAKHLSE